MLRFGALGLWLLGPRCISTMRENQPWEVLWEIHHMGQLRHSDCLAVPGYFTLFYIFNAEPLI